MDSDPFLLHTHRRNNPDCRHVCCTLPVDDLPLPTSGDWHLHASPPCTKLSIMQPKRPEAVREEAADLVRWYLNLAIGSSATSWSFEQVNQGRVREILDGLKRKHPLKVDWVVADAVDYGVPQHRRRIIAGSPFLIANLRMHKCKRKRCVRDVFPKAPMPFIRNALYSRPDRETGELVAVPLQDQIRSIDKPCFTILATGHCKWADGEGNVLRFVTGYERSLIQSFPTNYKLPRNKERIMLGVGNAVAPSLAAVLMRPTTK